MAQDNLARRSPPASSSVNLSKAGRNTIEWAADRFSIAPAVPFRGAIGASPLLLVPTQELGQLREPEHD